MFVIHADQVQAFAAQRRATFERDAVARLAERLARAIAPEEVHASVDRAFARGIETEPEVLQHAALELLVGGDLAVCWPWSEVVLEDPHLTPLGKLRTILRDATARGIDVSAADLVLDTRTS